MTPGSGSANLRRRQASPNPGGTLQREESTRAMMARGRPSLSLTEMAHLHEPHHTPMFWRRVERAMPDFARRKEELQVNGIDVEGL